MLVGLSVGLSEGIVKKRPLENHMVTKSYIKPTYLLTFVTIVTVVTVVTVATAMTVVMKNFFY